MPAASASSLSASLGERGWAVLHRTSEAKVEALSATLGSVFLRTDVRLDPRKGTYLTSPGAVPMHNDHPAVEYIAWHCQTPDPNDGAMLLVDTHDVESRYQVPDPVPLLPCPCIESLNPRTHHPIRDQNGWYYVDWHTRRAGLRDLAKAVEKAPRAEIHLESGDALFVANRRILHGRRGISPTSPRHLIRQWIFTRPPR